MAPPVCRCANSFYHLPHSGPWVPGRHPVFPAPSFIGGEATEAKLGRMSREDAKLCQLQNDALVPPDALQRPSRCCAEPGPMLQRTVRPAGSRLCAATLARCSASGTREGRMPRLHPPSLRAQRSNPDCLRREILDCFAALAMTTRMGLRHYLSAVVPAKAGTHTAESIDCIRQEYRTASMRQIRCCGYGSRPPCAIAH